MVSEKTAKFPLAETAKAVPVTVPREVKGLFCVPRFAGPMICAPKALPM